MNQCVLCWALTETATPGPFLVEGHSFCSEHADCVMTQAWPARYWCDGRFSLVGTLRSYQERS